MTTTPGNASSNFPGKPPVVDLATWEAAREELLVREKAHTREGDAIAAARRQLPMVELDGTVQVTGPDGPVSFLDLFQGRNELGGLLVAAGLGSAPEHALISLLALNGLRVSEATGADIEHLGLERGHRTLTITRKGGKVVTIPPAPRTARAIDLAIGDRTDGPVFLAADGRRLDRHGAGRIVRKTARHAGIGKAVTPRTLRHAFITAALDAGVPLRDVQEAASHADPRTTMRYDRARGSLDRHATYIVAAYVAGAAR